MTWINTIKPEEAEGKLKRIYDRVKGSDGRVDNILEAHSIRPNTLEGHMALYKNVLHHSANQLSTAYLETIGVFVSLLNQCAYCVEHHYEGLVKQLNDREKASEIRSALELNTPEKALDGKELQGALYAKMLTLNPATIDIKEIEKCRQSGLSDGEILEINQVTAYFNYANRTVLGLGVSTEGDTLGLSPNNSEDPNDWSHQTV